MKLDGASILKNFNLSAISHFKFPLAVGLVALGTLFINVSVYSLFVKPAEARLEQTEVQFGMLRMRPQIDQIVQDADIFFSEWSEKNHFHQDSMSAMNDLQRLADSFDLEVKQIQSQGTAKPINPSNSSADQSQTHGSRLPVTMEVSGGFKQLIGWLSSIEQKPGYQLESLNILPSKEGNSETCKVSILVLLGAA